MSACDYCGGTLLILPEEFTFSVFLTPVEEHEPSSSSTQRFRLRTHNRFFFFFLSFFWAINNEPFVMAVRVCPSKQPERSTNGTKGRKMGLLIMNGRQTTLSLTHTFIFQRVYGPVPPRNLIKGEGISMTHSWPADIYLLGFIFLYIFRLFWAVKQEVKPL